MNKTLALAVVMGTTAIFGAVAQATPLSGTFTVAVTTADTPNALSTSAIEQATPNGLFSSCSNGFGNQNFCSNQFTDSSFTYTGALNFNDPSGGTDTIAGFLNTGVGTYTGLSALVGNQTLSTSGFNHTSEFAFTFTLASALSGITITHDDGISLYKSGSSTDLFGGSASAPTSAETSTLASLPAGTYTLYYTEANGLPALLDFEHVTTSVPEPASLALLGTGLWAVGMIRRKRHTA